MIPRSDAAAVPVNSGKELLITAGRTPGAMGRGTKSTEFFSLIAGKSRPGPDMPDSTYSHCMTGVNDTTVVVIGGRLHSRSTFFFDLPSGKWTIGPKTLHPR